MGLTILAGGCRYVADTGKAEETRCNECPERGACLTEPGVQELATVFSKQWVATDSTTPPGATPILYLVYSSRSSSGTVHYGHYDTRRRRYIEQGSGNAFCALQVIAWMSLPKVPPEVYSQSRFQNRACLD
jgi:hypothetical protein